MKLSEVIKAIEDGSKNQFKLGTRNIEFNNRCTNNIFSNCGFDIPLDGWEEVKPPRQWSEKELMLFKLLPDWAKWIMRIAENIYCYEYEPNDSVPHRKMMCLNNFEFLKLENGEKHYIGDLKGE